MACYILGDGCTTKQWGIGIETCKTWDRAWGSECHHPGFQLEMQILAVNKEKEVNERQPFIVKYKFFVVLTLFKEFFFLN